jgi:hypothetical protein
MTEHTYGIYNARAGIFLQIYIGDSTNSASKTWKKTLYSTY